MISTMADAPRYRKRKLTAENISEIKRRCANGESQTEVAHAFGVTAPHVNKIVRGKRRHTSGELPSKEEVRKRSRTYHANWRKSNLEKVRTWSLLNIHNSRGEGKVMASEWADILELFDYRCAYCGVRDKMTVDHVTPMGSGGRNEADNLVPACGSCNLVKGNSGPLALVNRNFSLRKA